MESKTKKDIGLGSPLQGQKGVGPATAEKFSKLGIETVKDLLFHFPTRYEDYSKAENISSLDQEGRYVLKVRFEKMIGRYARRGLHITTADAVDDTGAVRVVWYNQPYRSKQIGSGEYYLHGNYSYNGKRYQFISPSVFKEQDIQKLDSLIVPIYKKTKGVTDHLIRQQMGAFISLTSKIPDTVPPEIHSNGMSLAEAVLAVHMPRTAKELATAQKKLTVDELFVAMLGAQRLKKEAREGNSFAIDGSIELLKRAISSLEFSLTNSQRLCLWEILKDLERGSPMNRLLQGDVGSGKSIVAMLATLHVHFSGFKTVYIAPTEVLAQQQYEGYKELSIFKNAKIVLLTGSSDSSQRKQAAKILEGETPGIVVGTHAILQESVAFKNVALVIVDEQHRFGVKQRGAIASKQSTMPHILTMTATPIPRSLALTYFGDLDISVIDEMPSNRKPVKTEVVPAVSRDQVYHGVVAEQVRAGGQCYVVAPSIETSDLSTRLAIDKLLPIVQKSLPDARIDVLHGKLKPEVKGQIMDRFLGGEIDVLVSTTVIEVGVNNPNATVMVIEGAEFFGLAQLHQLRGRVGRGDQQSFCFLIPSDKNSASDRLKALESTTSGSQLAELDLKLRGPGQIYGSLQSGESEVGYDALSDIELISEVSGYVKSFLRDHGDFKGYKLLDIETQRYNHLTLLN